MTEPIKRKRGRPPKTGTVESRMEQALKETKVVPAGERKGSRGPAPFSYEQRAEHIKYIIDCAAVGYSPTRIVSLLKERYGETADQVVSVKTVDGYIRRYYSDVQKREKELRAELPCMLPSMRIRYLQRVIDDAGAGSPVGVDKEGNVVLRKDFNAVIQAIKELNVMQKDIDSQKAVTEVEMRNQRQIEEQKEIIRQFVVERMNQSGKKELEILREMSGELMEEYGEAIEQLTSEYRM